MSEPLWYFAYGSNLDRDTFVGRRGMRPLEAISARLDGFDLVFDLPVGPGERGVANLLDALGGRVHGVAWAIPASQAAHLDKTEGVHRGYYLRRAVQVSAPDSRKIDAFTYQSSHGVPGRKPSRRYLGLLLRGALHHDLPREWIDTLRALDLAIDDTQLADRAAPGVPLTLRAALLLVAGLLAAGLYWLPEFIEPQAQGVLPHDPWPVSEESAALHAKSVVGDLHSDTLLWHRRLLERGDRGHVDLPRLREGNVAIQVFPAVTKAPLGQNYDSNSSQAIDLVTLLAVVQRWPFRTWTSLFERAIYQAQRLQQVEAAAPDELTILRSSRDLDALLAQRTSGESLVGGLLATEGLHPLEGELANVDRLFDAGYRMMGLQHFFDNELGGSLHGESGDGLTEFGGEVVRRLDELAVVIDVAHSSPAVVDDVLALTTRPIVLSHTGIHSACPTARNIDDARMQAIAARGGLIGIGYWDGAVCDIEPAGVVRSIRRAIEVVGVDHVALGSDYDGGTTVSFDTSELAALTNEMREQGMADAEIRAVMGGNLVRFLRAHLPHS